MTAADALYVVLAEHLGADFLTDDHHLAESPTFPRGVKVLPLKVLTGHKVTRGQRDRNPVAQ